MKKGFTLIELLTVIVILGIIAAITVPTINDLIKNSRKDACIEQKDAIIEAAKRWHTSTNGVKGTKEGNEIKVSIEMLQEEGFLDANKKYQNPIDDSDITEKEVAISGSNHKYTYTFDLNCEVNNE